MKRKYLMIASFVMVVLMVVVTAQVLATRNSDVDVDKTSRDKLTEYDIISPETTPLSCNEAECVYQMYQILPGGSTYNLGTHKLSRRECTEFNETLDEFNIPTQECLTYEDYTRAELEASQETQIANWLQKYGETLIERESRASAIEIISNSTTITINERGR